MIVGLLGMAGGWAGLAVGGAYGWFSWIYSYNRDAFMNDVQVKQAHVYQYDSMQISAHQMSREEIRDRTQAKITRLSNYILVTTLVLALAMEMLVEGQIAEDCADFVLNVYMLCLGSAMLYLVLSILYGVAASNVVYERSAELLTDKVPPPWKIIDDRMRRRKGQELTRAFEERPWREMFMPPLMRHNRFQGFVARVKDWRISRAFSKVYRCVTFSKAEDKRCAQQNYVECPTVEAPSSPRLPAASRPRLMTECSEAPRYRGVQEDSRSSSVEVEPPRENFTASQQSEQGAAKFGLKQGVERRLHCIKEDYLDVWVEFEHVWAVLLRQSGLCASLGFKSLLEAYGYYSMATLYGAYGSEAWAFWAVQILFTSLNVIIMQFVFRFENRWRASLVSFGPVCCAISATTFWEWIDRILVPLCYMCHFVSSCQTFFILVDLEEKDEDQRETNGETFGCRSWVFGSIAQQMKLSQGLLCETAENLSTSVSPSIRQTSVEECETHGFQDPVSVPKLKSSSSKQLTHLDEDRWDQDIHPGESVDTGPARAKDSRDTADLASDLMRRGRLVVTSLWFLSVCWAVHKAVNGHGFRNSMAVLKQPLPAGPPVAGVVPIRSHWPSPYFKPHSVVCPKGRVFIGDEFRVFELMSDRKVVPYPCDVDGRIADVAADCNETACWPVILVQNTELAILDCSTGSRRPLLQAEGPAERFAQANHSISYASHEGQVVQYEWSNRRSGWAPTWTVADVGKGNVRAMDVVGGRLLVFSRGIVEVRDLSSGTVCGVWNLPSDVWGAGCAFAGGRSVLLLGHSDPSKLDGGVELMCAELRGQNDCRDELVHDAGNKAENPSCSHMVADGAGLALPRDRF